MGDEIDDCKFVMKLGLEFRSYLINAFLTFFWNSDLILLMLFIIILL